MVPERHERPAVCRDRVVGEVARHDLPQPSPLFGDGLVPASPHLLLHVLKFRSQAVAPGLPLEQEFALARLSADEREPEELERLRFTDPTLLAVRRRKAAELDQAGLVRMQRQRKLLQPFAHGVPEASGVGLMFKANDRVVGVSHDDHVARGLPPSPAIGPEIEHVVQVDVCKER